MADTLTRNTHTSSSRESTTRERAFRRAAKGRPDSHEHVPAADPMVGPLRTCAGCTQPLGRGVVYTSTTGGDTRQICHRCLHDPEIVPAAKRNQWADAEAPYMRLRLVVPGQAPRILEVTDFQSVVIGRKLDKFERLRGQLLSNQAEVEYVFEAVDDRKVGGIHVMFSYSRRSRTFRVMSYAKDKRRTFCDRPITANTALITGAKSVQGYQVLTEMEFYHVMFAGTKVLLINPDEGPGPRIIVDDIRGCMGLEGFRQVTNRKSTIDETSEEQRASADRVWNYGSTQTASSPFSFDLAVNISAGYEVIRLVSQAVVKPDRAIIFSGTVPGRHKPEMLERGEANPAGSGYASAIPEELEGFLITKLKDKHKDAWTHVYRVPVESETFHGPLFMVRYHAERSMYVMIPIHDELRKSRRGESTLIKVVGNKTHEFHSSLVVAADTVRFSVVPFKRMPTKVFPPHVAIRTENSLTLEWLPAESPAPVIRYEIWEKLGAEAYGNVYAPEASTRTNTSGEGAATEADHGSLEMESTTDQSLATTVEISSISLLEMNGEGVVDGGVSTSDAVKNAVMLNGCEGLLCSLRVSNLQPNTRYELFLVAYTDDGGVKSAVVRVATSTMPAAPKTGLQLDVDTILSVSEEAIVSAANYGDTPMAVTEFEQLHTLSNKAAQIREKIEVLQGLIDHDNVARFLGGTEYPVIGSDDVIFQIRHEMPKPSVASVWPRFGGPNVAPRVCHQVTIGLAFLHANGIIHRNLNPRNVVIRSSIDALEANPDSILSATFAIANFDLAVMEPKLRKKLSKPVRGAVQRAWAASSIGADGSSEPRTLTKSTGIARAAGAGTSTYTIPGASSESESGTSGLNEAGNQGSDDEYNYDNERFFKRRGPLPRPRASFLRGDRNYGAPEILTLADDADPSSVVACAGDIYSLGVLGLTLVMWKQGETQPPELYELLMGGILELNREGREAVFKDGQRLCHEHAFIHLKELLRLLYLVNSQAARQGDEMFIERLEVVGTTVDEKPNLVPSAITFLNFLAACLRLGPDDRITAAALLEDESVGQRWFALAGGTVDIRCREQPPVLGEGEESECAGCAMGRTGTL